MGESTLIAARLPCKRHEVSRAWGVAPGGGPCKSKSTTLLQPINESSVDNTVFVRSKGFL